MARAYYSNTIDTFLNESPNQILGTMVSKHEFDLDERSRDAWIGQINILKSNLVKLNSGHVFLEYSIPRMGKRVDTIVLFGGIIFVIEFKVGEKQYTAHAIDQVMDYGLDLKNFHQESHKRSIIPVLIATEAEAFRNTLNPYEDLLYQPLKANKNNLGNILLDVAKIVHAGPISAKVWESSIYKPTPTIIEAAQALFRNHSVKEISRADAGAINLSHTSNAIAEIIETAKANKQKSICFVTGVPGAGKTLAGLNIAIERLKTDENEHAVFLSGNGPLVKVLREALARNKVELAKENNQRLSKKIADMEAQTFIQNIHHFRDEALDSDLPPLEKVVVFDEAQRAWTIKKTADFMKTKRGYQNFSMSEPHFLISVMDRHPDWAVIIGLIGGGQEINTGEAGLLEWFSAIKQHYPNWHVYASNNLTEQEYTRGREIRSLVNHNQLQLDTRLHLAVSLRSFRSEKVSEFVKAVLDNQPEYAFDIYQTIKENYPIKLTRNLDKARQWVKEKARGTERYGLLASSGGSRLRPTGINVKAEIDVVYWFLNDKRDVRSSYYLEDVATEFDIQGLELDWTAVAWDADLRYVDGAWQHKTFHGSLWKSIKDETSKYYLINAYRVLLTRARQGFVIYIPNGTLDDHTRQPHFYDGTYAYLRSIGLEEVD
jgi:DUF2075 family protein